MAKPSGIRITAGPGSTNIATPTIKMSPPTKNMINLRHIGEFPFLRNCIASIVSDWNLTSAEADPFFQLNGSEDNHGHTDDTGPRVTSYGRGMEQSIHNRCVGEEKLDRDD